MSWESESLVHMREDGDLTSQMVAAGMQINIWIRDVVEVELSRVVDWSVIGDKRNPSTHDVEDGWKVPLH